MKLKSNPSGLHSSKSLLLAASALLASATILPAEVTVPIVSWGGDYVDANKLFNGSYTFDNGLTLDGTGTGNDSRYGYAYNAAAPAEFNPQTGYSGTSDIFYGGFVINKYNLPSDAADGLQPNAQGIHQQGPNDHIKFQTQTNKSHDHTFALLMYWDKADFLNGANNLGTDVFLNSSSTFTLTTKGSTNVPEDIHLHFIIQDGDGQFWASQAFWGGNLAAQGETGYQGTFPDGGSATYNPFTLGLGWAKYNPTGLALQWQHGAWESPTFDTIKGVGFYIDTLNPSQNNHDLEIEGFSVIAAIPEPSRAMLALSGLGMIMLRRRRARA